MSFVLWVPALPDRVLSPNAGEVKVIAKVSEARAEMHTQVMFAALDQHAQPWPTFARVRVGIVYMHTYKRPPGDPYYRPRDVPNAVAALKPVYDALHRELELFPDDSATFMELGEHRIKRVEELADEGLLITVEELP